MRILLLIPLLAVLNTVRADFKDFEISLLTLDRSYHYYDPDNEYNEDHKGLGIQFRVKDTDYGVVSYKNSFNDDSVLFTFTESDADHGFVVGVAIGYSAALVPTMGYHFTLFKVFRITFMPMLA